MNERTHVHGRLRVARSSDESRRARTLATNLAGATLLGLLLPGAALAASITLSATSTSVPVSGLRTFGASVTGLSNTAVSWEVDGKPGGSASSGTITAAGVYTAPATIAVAPTLVTVTARAAADPTVKASALVTVRWQIPWLTTVAPMALPAGSAFTLDITGSRFVAGARAFLGTSPLATTFVDATHLRASGSTGSDQIGNLSLRVENPGAVSSTTFQLVGVPGATAGVQDPDVLAATRFLEQATFGPTDADIAWLMQVGEVPWLAQQMDPVLTPPSQIADGLGVQQVSAEWTRQMGNAPDQLRQRMAFALSQVFVVSMWKNTNGDELLPYLRVLQRNAFGNFRTLLQEMTLSPSMGKYLDLAGSRKPSAGNLTGANENYARELMQLFTIGTYRLEQDGLASLDANGQTISTYDQDAVRGMALALTGWVYPTAPGKTTGANNPPYFQGSMQAWDPSHDKGAKTIFDGIAIPAGLTAPAELNLVLDRLFQHPNVPPFFATRLIRSLVTSNPSPAYVRRVADVFVNNGQGVRGDLAAVLAATLLDPEARQDDATSMQGHVKDPILHVLGFVRALGGKVTDAGQVLYLFGNLGQRPLASPTVFSYYSPLAPLPGHVDLYGPEFQVYTPALAIQRANFLYGLLSGQMSTAFALDLTPYVNAATDPYNLVSLVDLKLFHGGMSLPLRQAILNDCIGVTDAKQRAVGALYLAAISSEYATLR